MTLQSDAGEPKAWGAMRRGARAGLALLLEFCTAACSVTRLVAVISNKGQILRGYGYSIPGKRRHFLGDRRKADLLGLLQCAR